MSAPSPFILVNLADVNASQSHADQQPIADNADIAQIANDAFDQAAFDAASTLAKEMPVMEELEWVLKETIGNTAAERTSERLRLLEHFVQQPDNAAAAPRSPGDSGATTAMSASVNTLLKKFTQVAPLLHHKTERLRPLQRFAIFKGLGLAVDYIAGRIAARGGVDGSHQPWSLVLHELAQNIVAAERDAFMKKVFGPEEQLNSRFIKTLNASARGTARSTSRASGVTNELLLTAVFNDLQTGVISQRVGIIDMDAWVIKLGDLINRINQSQDAYTLFDVRTPMPAGMVKSNAAVRAWISDHADQIDGPPHSSPEYDEVDQQMFMEDFLVAATPISQDIGVHMIVGITPARVAGLLPVRKGQQRKKLFTDDFSAVQVRQAPVDSEASWVEGLPRAPIALLSTSDLRDFAREAHRAYEVAIGVLLIGAILVADIPEINYHDDCGCLFDRNEGEQRNGIIKVLESLSICDQCRKVLGSHEYVADALVGCLAAIPRPIHFEQDNTP